MISELKEIWKTIIGYEGLYEVSNLGSVKSLAHTIMRSNNQEQYWRERILKPGADAKGYLRVVLCVNRKMRTYKIHHLVWDAFGDKPRNGGKIQVDHEDADKKNNRINNLQLLTNRENCSKGHRQRGKKYNLPTGVTWDKKRGKLQVQIHIKGKSKHLGRFELSELKKASQAYQKALSEIEMCK